MILVIIILVCVLMWDGYKGYKRDERIKSVETAACGLLNGLDDAVIRLIALEKMVEKAMLDIEIYDKGIDELEVDFDELTHRVNALEEIEIEKSDG